MQLKYVVAVRALCEFTAREGDLDLRFTPSPTAQEGIAGHAAVAARRPAHYQSEISLAGEFGNLAVRGRADGYDPQSNRLEEVKTHRGDLDAMPDNHRRLHWAQLKVYGWLMCEKLGMESIALALVYFDVGSQKETVSEETWQADALRRFFEEQCLRFIDWAERELAHRAARDAALTALRFPHAEFRPGQRALAESVYKAAASGRCMMAQAPTGIGKSVGTLFPILKAAPGQQIDKVFFLAAKTSGRALALEALELIRASHEGLPLRVLELTARDKACVHPDKACHGDSCPLAKGFYDRLPQARRAALDDGRLDQVGLRETALAHDICPYYLAQDLARWTDVVVGDYNYYFDLHAMLYALATGNQWRVAVLADEAHNLVERARKMYSAELDQAALRPLRKEGPSVLRPALDRVNRQWNVLKREHLADERDYHVLPLAPDKFLGVLQKAVTEITDYFAEFPAETDPALQRFYFDALHFCRLAEQFERTALGRGQNRPAEDAEAVQPDQAEKLHSMFDLTREPGRRDTVLCLRNIVPAPFLAPRFAAARTAVLFSATLGPAQYYRDMLGMPEDAPWIEVESPFRAEQLAVKVVRDVSTRFRDRDASLAPIAGLMARQFLARPGNYLAFFSSFDYLEKALATFAERYPQVPVWSQTRRMEEAERNAFLARFVAGGQGIGFAVLGGAFGEGIDLPGDRLIGAFIATLGLPQINAVNEQLRLRMEETFGSGYDYAYFYPGMQKVVQAAGRVIRTQQDEGTVLLIDDRFARADARRLMPGWWKVQLIVSKGEDRSRSAEMHESVEDNRSSSPAAPDAAMPL